MSRQAQQFACSVCVLFLFFCMRFVVTLLLIYIITFLSLLSSQLLYNLIILLPIYNSYQLRLLLSSLIRLGFLSFRTSFNYTLQLRINAFFSSLIICSFLPSSRKNIHAKLAYMHLIIFSSLLSDIKNKKQQTFHLSICNSCFQLLFRLRV